MKYLILLGDGMGDYPIPELGGKTPLEVARIPHMNSLARRGELGMVRTAPKGFYPGSDVTQMGILGYDPKLYYTGRSPLEAASMGVHLSKDDVAYRCNLVTLRSTNDGYRPRKLDAKVTMEDYSAGHIGTEEARELIFDINDQLGTEAIQFSPGVSYRHLMVWAGGKHKVTCTPPHDIAGRSIADHLPAGDGSEVLREIMEASLAILSAHPINAERESEGRHPANCLWLWGQGKAPRMPKFFEKYGLSGSMISAVDLLKGLGVYAGFEIITVPGATGYLDTNYTGKGETAVRELSRKGLVYVHVEAPDEAAHNGDLTAKIRAIEDVDEKVLGTILKGIDAFDDYKILLLPDHRTPIALKTHTDEPVPFVIYKKSASGGQVKGSGLDYNEVNAEKTGLFFKSPVQLLTYFLKE